MTQMNCTHACNRTSTSIDISVIQLVDLKEGKQVRNQSVLPECSDNTLGVCDSTIGEICLKSRQITTTHARNMDEKTETVILPI